MGGQACVLYGAAEFSRDVDLAIIASPANLSRLRKALAEMKAEVIAVPPFDLKYLRRGHAIHFRSFAPETNGLRIDVMTNMRGVDSFAKLWRRRVTLEAKDGTSYELMSLPDLVTAKKTQRDKDWPMIRRLVEGNYFEHREHATRLQLEFWFLELRTAELLFALATEHPKLCHTLAKRRQLLKFASSHNTATLTEALSEEESAEREADRRYWAPLKSELEKLRHARLAL